MDSLIRSNLGAEEAYDACEHLVGIDYTKCDQEALATLRTRLVKGALVLIFLIYPGISSETVKSFRWVAICSDAALLLLGHGCGGASRTSAACAQRGAVLGTHVANDVFYVYFKLFTF